MRRRGWLLVEARPLEVGSPALPIRAGATFLPRRAGVRSCSSSLQVSVLKWRVVVSRNERRGSRLSERQRKHASWRSAWHERRPMHVHLALLTPRMGTVGHGHGHWCHGLFGLGEGPAPKSLGPVLWPWPTAPPRNKLKSGFMVVCLLQGGAISEAALGCPAGGEGLRIRLPSRPPLAPHVSQGSNRRQPTSPPTPQHPAHLESSFLFARPLPAVGVRMAWSRGSPL